MKHRRPPHSQKAFSLVEVALAIGVIAFAFVGLLSLLPVGLSNFRGAVDLSVGAQIFQRVAGDAEQADFDLLVGQATKGSDEFYVLPTRYFDEQGTEIVPRVSGQPSSFEAAQIVYQVRVRGSLPGPNVVNPKGTERFTSLPAVTTGFRFAPRDSTILTVQIAHLPGALPLPVNDLFLWEVPGKKVSGVSLVTYSTVITRNGFSRKAEAASTP